MLPRVGMVATPDNTNMLVPLLQSLGFSVTALWCRTTEVCSTLAEKFKVPFRASTFKEVLLHPEVDLVYVATEPGMHAEVAVKALTSGKHCICQKPPSISQSEAEKMVNLSRYYSQLMSLLDSHLRFLPAVAMAKKLVASGYCGEVLAIESRVVMGSLVENEAYSWKCDTAMGGGALSIMGGHIIDLVSFISGHHAEKVHAFLKTFRAQTDRIHGYRTITSDDFCTFQLQCTGGVCATCTLNTHVAGKFEFDFSITGSKAKLSVRGMDLYGCQNPAPEELLYRQELADLQSFDLSFSSLPQDFSQQVYIGSREMLSALKNTFTVSKQSFLDSKPQSTPPLSLSPAATFEDGIYIRTVLDALFKSHSTGRWVTIPKTTFVESTNPFWTSSAARLSTDKPSPKTHRPVFV